jgi:hypothetical protein
MNIRLSKSNFKEDMARGMAGEKSENFVQAALSYKKAQHHAASAGLNSKAQFAMARRILCLKNSSDQQWRQINEKFHQLYQVTGDR